MYNLAWVNIVFAFSTYGVNLIKSGSLMALLDFRRGIYLCSAQMAQNENVDLQIRIQAQML